MYLTDPNTLSVWALSRIFPRSQLLVAVAAAASVSTEGDLVPGHSGCPLCVTLFHAPGGFRWLRKSNAEKSQDLHAHLFLLRPAHFHIKEWSFSVFNRAEAILELQCIPVSCTNCVFWHCPNHITPPFPPSSFLNIPPLLRTLNKQLGNGGQRKLKWIFGTPDGVEETENWELFSVWLKWGLWSLITQEG